MSILVAGRKKELIKSTGERIVAEVRRTVDGEPYIHFELVGDVLNISYKEMHQAIAVMRSVAAELQL